MCSVLSWEAGGGSGEGEGWKEAADTAGGYRCGATELTGRAPLGVCVPTSTPIALQNFSLQCGGQR